VRKEDLAYAIALLQAEARCGLSVYMDGSHNPTPHEWREARDLADIVQEEGVE